MENLIKKYNVAIPRYTSYPATPAWNKELNEFDWLSSIRSVYNADSGLDLYIHIPFCEKLCYYCGCHRFITKNKDKGLTYVEALIKEWNLIKKRLGFRPKIHTIHFGGGTPTFLRPEDLNFLLESILEGDQTISINSIEIDPRTCLDEHLDILSKFNFKRVSMGIQDFDPKVQKAINREQPFELVKSLVNKLREKGIPSINFDLIYGLPYQTKETIEDTICKVIELGADMIAFYSYAHLPSKFSNQKLIPNEALPSGLEKRELFEAGKEIFLKNKMIEVGLDHFAKEDNYLAKAKNEKRLVRSFMGHTDKKSDILLGLGVSSISESPVGFYQNVKEIKDYYEMIEANKIPNLVSHLHTNADVKTKAIIESIMCNEFFMSQDLKELPYQKDILAQLETMIEEKLIERNEDYWSITALGKVFLRNIAHIFDYRMREQEIKTTFSQSL